jgi:hypothetical protein
VNFDSLSLEYQKILINTVEHHLFSMNIFCTYNVLWGLARMGASTAALGPSLSAALLDKSVTLLHTFLPTQYGDVIWSLGSLGYNLEALSPVQKDRILAVLSRVYGKLHVRAAAYTLWGLSKMGLQWEDLKVRTRSLAGGREADPLSESVNKYLRQRVASMREHEYSVLLYSLGGLRAQLQGNSETCLPPYVTDKIHHRATRVSAFLSSRSLANALYGMGKCGVNWMELPVQTRDAWEGALLQPSNPPVAASATGRNRQRGRDLDRKGLWGMRNIEFAQTMFGLGQMQVPWDKLNHSTREVILREASFKDRIDNMNSQALSSALWGLAAMNCPLDDVPCTILDAARTRFVLDSSFKSGSIRVNTDELDVEISVKTTATQSCDAIIVDDVVSEGRSNDIRTVGSISENDYMRIERLTEDGSVRQQQQQSSWKSPSPSTSLDEAGMSVAMCLDALARLHVSLTAEELQAVSMRLDTLALHMDPDTIVSCVSGLSGLGVTWSNLAVETRQSWITRLKSSEATKLTSAKRQSLSASLKKMSAY